MTLNAVMTLFLRYFTDFRSLNLGPVTSKWLKLRLILSAKQNSVSAIYDLW